MEIISNACATGLPWPHSALCHAPYWPNIKVLSRNKWHAGGSALVPYLTAYRVQGCLFGVVVSVMPRSNLPNWPLSTCVGYCEWSLPILSVEGILSVPFAHTTLMQTRAFTCVKWEKLYHALEWITTLKHIWLHQLGKICIKTVATNDSKITTLVNNYMSCNVWIACANH